MESYKEYILKRIPLIVSEVLVPYGGCRGEFVYSLPIPESGCCWLSATSL